LSSIFLKKYSVLVGLFKSLHVQNLTQNLHVFVKLQQFILGPLFIQTQCNAIGCESMRLSVCMLERHVLAFCIMYMITNRAV